jgi:hypothetical protein
LKQPQAHAPLPRSVPAPRRDPESRSALQGDPCFYVNAPRPTPAFDRGNRTYYVSDERMRAFGQLSVAQRMQWVEQCAQFVRLAQAAKSQATPQPR